LPALVVDEVVAALEIPGAETFLRLFVEKLPLFVVSAAPKPNCRKLSDFGVVPLFPGGDRCSQSKRENLAILLQKHDLAAGHCLFFGDAEADYWAAQACGVRFIGIVPGPGAPLLQAEPQIDWCRDFTEMVRLISGDR
jgi:phosphoglycolate phosphatase-like HAD superfamily hydrolase